MTNLSSVLSIAIPAITFFLTLLVGMDLKQSDFQSVRLSPRGFYVGMVSQYLLPLVVIVTLRLLKPGGEIAAGMIIVASAPGGGISNYYSYLARVNVALSVVLTTISCAAAPLTMPLLLKIFETLIGRPLDFHVPMKMFFGQLALLLLLPVLLGFYIRRSKEAFVLKHQRMLRLLGLSGIATLIVFVLYETRQLFLIQGRSIAEVALVFVLLSMTLGYLSGMIGRLNRSDSFTLLIECGVRNVAIATTAAVVILGRTEFATFAATYFLMELLLILCAIFIFRRLAPIRATIQT